MIAPPIEPSTHPAHSNHQKNRADFQVCAACGGNTPRGNPAEPLSPAASMWPAAIGGSHAPKLFMSEKFCIACAALAENTIDQAFLKGWSMQGEMFRAALSFMDPLTPGPAPLTYLGIAAEFETETGDICERWSGLAGEQIFHVHAPEPTAWLGFAGANAVAPPDPGSVTLVLDSNSQYWASVAILSLATYFPHARRFIIDRNAPPKPGAPGMITFEHQFTPRQRAYFAGGKLGRLTLNPSLATDGSHRFLIKLALALGKNLFGIAFIRTASARRLRKNFWAAHPQVRRGKIADFFAQRRGAAPIDAVWTLVIGIFNAEFGLRIVSPQGHALDIVIADEASLWASAEFSDWHDPQVYLVVPQRDVFEGPIAFSQFLAHQERTNICAKITQVEALRVAAQQLPSRKGLM